MLSRNAANLYWLGRYVERADYVCRLLDATVRLAALPASHGGAVNAWEAALESASAAASFRATGRRLNEAEVGHFLALAPDHPGSIRCCLELARTNARALRTALTTETWQAINSAWLEVQRFGTDATDPLTLVRLVETVKQSLLAFDGAAHRNQLREATYWFMRLGTSIERADNTARLLDQKYHILLPRTERVGGSLDYFQWTTLLRTVSAYTAYRWVYRDAVKPWLVADLLILRHAMPRSLAACYDDAVFYLDRLALDRGRQGPANRLAVLGSKRLEALSIDTIFAQGLHEFLLQFIADNHALGDAIAEQYLF
jgi:uncharacterized alpha-E superfamily protein